jgi:signal transduction histidine kinase
MKTFHAFHSSRQRPHWWPENEPWPPHMRSRPRRFFARMGCIFMLFNLFSLVVLAGIIVLASRWLGLVKLPFHPGQWLIPIGGVVFVFVILVTGLGGIGIRRLVAPLDDLLKAADHIGRGDYAARVSEKGPREVRSLARAFNIMASRLQVSNEQRKELLADVTHELRTPLTIIQGNLEGMLDGVYPASETNLRSLQEETNILARLVEDLRTLALAESGSIQLRKEATDLSMLIRETVNSFKAQAEKSEVVFNVEYDEDLPWLEIDPGRIHQVLSNLFTNALRYTPAGGHVYVRYQQADNRALLEIQDTGNGIPADELPHVFERFYKSADSGGMGLGLAIARHLVEAHGGTIKAESAPGRGTTMQITLPMD